MPKASFVIYGCPYTAFEETKDIEAFVVPEPNRTLYHLNRNTHRILNMVGFSGVKDVRLVGCSREFIEDFSALLAEYPAAGFRLDIEEKKCTAFSRHVTGDPNGADVIVVEGQPDLIPIAHQLAREKWAKIVLVDPTSDQEATAFAANLKDFEECNGLARQNGLNACRAFIEKKLGAGFLSGSFSSATFITKLPFNLYPFRFPTGHLRARVAGELATAGLLKARTPRLQAGVTVILDSGNTQVAAASEYGALRDLLCSSYGVLPVHKPADLGDFQHFVEDIPVDLIFLTAHSIQMALTNLEATFSFKGRMCRAQYAVDRGISSIPQSGLIGCQTSYVPIEVNGVSWKADECERELFLKFAKVEMDASLGMKPKDSEFENIKITVATNTTPIRFPAKCIKCGDDQNFVPLTHTIGCYYFPLVFNNACASFSGICEEFVPDASFYVGTTRGVDSFSAVEVVNKFAQNLGNMTVGEALFKAQYPFINDYTPYLLAGVPWLTIPRFASPAAAIMKASSLLKDFRYSNTGNAREDHTRSVFQEQQRNLLLRQLFPEGPKT
ncbi:MAG: hypothetical protein ABSC38_08395 [Verrucomicrobiia bacterium]